MKSKIRGRKVKNKQVKNECGIDRRMHGISACLLRFATYFDISLRSKNENLFTGRCVDVSSKIYGACLKGPRRGWALFRFFRLMVLRP